MNTVYRTYEVLIEETLSGHDPKRQRTSKPSRENANTRRALETTHRLFQDAVCYYMLCLVGLVRDATETGSDGKPRDINPLWRTLTTGKMGKQTDELMGELSRRYPSAPWTGATSVTQFLERVLCWKKTTAKPTAGQLRRAYEVLFAQATAGKAGDELADSLEDLKSFAGTWIAILSNENGDTTLPGGGVYDVLHRRLRAVGSDDAKVLEEEIASALRRAQEDRESSLSDWQAARLEKANSENEKATKKKTPEQISSAVAKAVTDKNSKEAVTLRDAYLKAFSADKTKSYCSLNEEQIAEAVKVVRSIPVSAASFPRLRYGARDNGFEQPLFRYLLLHRHPEYREVVIRDVWDYVRNAEPEDELVDEGGNALSMMPYQDDGTEPLFPYFTNCLGISAKERAVWFDFDKSAFKRAAEEVFKYRIRSDKRQREYDEKAQKVRAMEARGHWPDAKGKTKELGGIECDPRAVQMKVLLEQLGGSIGYGLTRSTIGGWADLRDDFIKASKGKEPDGEELEGLVNQAQADSGGGFGSAAFFKKLCEPEYFVLWQEQWEDQKPWHPKNFISWYVKYAEAVDELKRLTESDEGDAVAESVDDGEERVLRLKPISITLPGTKNRHGEVSFRPLDMDCGITPHPHLDLFDLSADGKYSLVRTNQVVVKEKLKDGGPDGAEYPLTLSYRRLKRDRITNREGLSMEAFYQPPLVVEAAPDFHQEAKDKAAKAKKEYKAPAALVVSSSLLPPVRDGGPFHLTMAMAVETDGLMKDTPKIDNGKHPDPSKRSEKSIRYTPPLNGAFYGANLRWPVDAESEKATEPEGEPNEDNKARKKPKTALNGSKFWCSKDFEPFHILSVDLGVRFAGAWCRAKVFKGEPKEGQRVISAARDEGKTGKIVFGVEHLGTFRLQGEDVKMWRKRKGQAGHTFEQEPCGSQGRRATETEIAEFLTLANRIVPASKRTPLPDAQEMKYAPQLAGHLQFRLARKLGQLRMLFNLRWRVLGRVEKQGHVYVPLTGDELDEFVRKQRLRVIEMLDFRPREDDPNDEEESYMKVLRLSLATEDSWVGLTFPYKGKPVRLFGKQRTKDGKAAQKAAQGELAAKLADETGPWNWKALADEVTKQVTEGMAAFTGTESLVAKAAHFVWPLIKKRWNWSSCEADKEGAQSVLECVQDETAAEQNITGMRGLNMRRVELLQEFRRCCQSLAKLERRYYREPDKGLEPSPVRDSDRIHEPAPAWIEKINELRDQRVNQTAHLILAEALGLELMNPDDVDIEGMKKAALKTERDVHGRYVKRTDKPRVAAIVLEDLSRYRTSQDRSRFENRQLMEWSHRQVLTKLQDMAKVFGIQIFTVDARYSSRFSSRSGAPGVRCAEVSKGFELEHPWKKWAEETVANKKGQPARIPSERAVQIKEAVDLLRDADARASLILPLDGGPAFFPVVPHRAGSEGFEPNADINAAVNIGLRAVAHPDRFDVFPLLKAAPKAAGALEIQARRGSFAVSTQILHPVSPPEEKLVMESSDGDKTNDDDDVESGKIRYLFASCRVRGASAFAIANGDRYELTGGYSGAVTKVYWSRVKQECSRRIREINAARIAAWKAKARQSDPDDQLP